MQMQDDQNDETSFLPRARFPKRRFCRMNIVSSISEVEVESTSTLASWSEVCAADLPSWNDKLLRSGAALYQFPFWNEPYRRMGLTPRYLAWGSRERALAATTILTVGFGPTKIGLVFRGPARLVNDAGFSSAMFSELVDWARLQGYMFLRFTHADPEVLSQLAAAGEAIDGSVFPYFLDYSILSGDYVVEQHATDEETLATFDREARRKIRRATEAGYEYQSSTCPKLLAEIWPMFQECARTKHFRLERPLSFYVDLMHGAAASRLAKLSTVHHGGKIVGATLIFRDRDMAHCQLAAFDAEHRQSATFLHWHAMRDMYRMGARRYNLGPGPGLLARFKSTFCANPVQYPAPLTIVIGKKWFGLWKKAFLPVAKQLHPMFRKLALRRSARSE